MSRLRHPLGAVAVTVAVTLPWLAVWATDTHTVGCTHVSSFAAPSWRHRSRRYSRQYHPGAALTVACSGLASLGASFLLAWGAETAEACAGLSPAEGPE